MNMDLLIEIKKKREFAKLDDKLVLKLLQRNKSYKKFLQTENERYGKIAVKEVRALLRKIITPMPKKFYKKFESYKDNIDKSEAIEELLNLNRATKEREKVYPWLADLLSSRRIADFGCGFNLLGLYKNGMNFSDKIYVGYDADGYATEIVEEFARKKGINAKIIKSDITSINFEKEKADISLFLKVLDALEELELGFSKKILTLKGKKIVSFSLKSLSGKKIRERIWFEKLLQKQNIKFEKIVKEYEVFYLF